MQTVEKQFIQCNSHAKGEWTGKIVRNQKEIRQTDKKKNRQTDKQTNRQTDKQKN
jgi:hypothetical protein